MAWSIKIDFGGGAGYQDLCDWDGEELVLHDSVERTEILHNDKFEPVQDSFKFQALLRESLSDAILDMGADDVALVDADLDGEDFFTGYVRPVTGIKIFNEANDSVQFECLDNSYRLQSSTQEPIEYEGYKVCDPSDKPNSIVHQLLEAAGYTLGTDEDITETISTTITHYRRETGDHTFEELLKEQLYNYGYVYYFDESGVFRLYKWLLDSSPVAAATLDDDDLQNLDIKIEDYKPEQYVVSWYEVKKRTRVTLWRSPGGSGNLGESELWPSNKTHHFSYNPGSGNRVLKSENHGITWDASASTPFIGQPIIELSRETYLETQLSFPFYLFLFTDTKLNEFSTNGLAGTADIQFQGRSQNLSDQINSYSVFGDVYVLVKKGQVKNPDTPGTYTVRKIEAENVTSQTEAQELAQALQKHNQYGRFKYRFSSESERGIGDYIDVSNTKINRTTTVRVVRRKWSSKNRYILNNVAYPIYDYEVVGVSELGVLTGDVETGQYTTPATGDEIVDAVARVNAGLDGAGQVIRIVNGNNVEDVEPTETGIYLTKTHIGFWDSAESDWVAKIENDSGTGKFFVGDPWNYVRWDGLELTVRGSITADVGEIGGWVIDDPELRDSQNRMFLRPQKRRLEIRDGLGNTKIALGYLGGVESFEETQYGLYIADGNTVEVNGDIDYAAGDWAISDDAAVVIKDTAGTVVGRFGSLGSGDVGLVIGGNAFADTLTGGGGASSSMEDDITGGGSAIGIFVELSFDPDVTGGGNESSSMEASLTGGGDSSSIMTDLIGGYGAELPDGSVEGTFGSLIGGGVASGVGVRYSNDDRQLTVRGAFQANTLRLVELPLSDEGLDTGELWNDGGTLKIKV